MNKAQFLDTLCQRFAGCSNEDVVKSLDYYSEIIDDYMEDGLTEEEAVKAVGSIDEIVSQTVKEMPIAKLVKARVKPKRRLKVSEIVLLVLGAPIWLPLICAAVAVLLSVYISVWSIIISLYASAVGSGGAALGGILAAVAFAISGNSGAALVLLGIGIAGIGVTIFMVLFSNLALKGLLLLSKKILLGIKSQLFKKGDAK